jgi:hypothetical protein
MLKSEQNAIERLLSWSNQNNYFDDVYRTLVQTGTVYVCRSDIFAMKQKLKHLGIMFDSLTICSSHGGYFLTLDT